MAPIDTVNLYYRVMFQDELTITMVDDGTAGDERSGDGIYTGVIPAVQHQAISTLARKTNHLERFNNTWRQRVSRRVRSTLSCSKTLVNHIGDIKYFAATT